jgi:uroporphyrinogen III methyltransferase/synthase
VLKPVVVTRAEPPGGPLTRALEALGLQVLHWAAVSIVPTDAAEFARALARESPFDWIVLTSLHGADALTQAWPAAPSGARVAAVEPATAAALRERGWPVDLGCEEGGAEGLLRAFASVELRGRRVLHPASSRALPALGEGLTRMGAEVVRLEAYRTMPGSSLDVGACRATIARQGVGAVTFASPSAVIELESALGDAHLRRLLDTTPAVAIGPTTARALTDRGCAAIVAEPHTLRGLAECCHALARKAQPGAQDASESTGTNHNTARESARQPRRGETQGGPSNPEPDAAPRADERIHS